MKYIWEPEDIKPGVRVKKPDSEVWLIGYMSAAGGNLKAMISLTDGMITTFESAENVCKALNHGGYIPASGGS